MQDRAQRKTERVATTLRHAGFEADTSRAGDRTEQLIKQADTDGTT